MFWNHFTELHYNIKSEAATGLFLPLYGMISSSIDWYSYCAKRRHD
ncbi:hypothetical protein T12_14337 [Trichinella patagoniensis]|uniref:Uncharacterized protein n=1 Tax=Trichinella patagoniensis TaxID=990121 RepID=A0A0V0YQU1_9BILA|nr:hypothetical protein T12_14337 [Trichinella patagoniensis]